MSDRLPIIGMDDDDRERLGEAYEKALDAAAQDALYLNGRADQAICYPSVTQQWALKQNARFDPAPWLDDDGTFDEQLPRDDCPADVLMMFIFTGSERQVKRAVYLLRELAVRELATDADVIARAEKAPVPRTKPQTLAYYSSMARAAVEAA